MGKRKPIPEHRVVGHALRLRSGADGTTWPWPFYGDADSPAWKARYAPEKLTRGDLLELAEIANAYSTLITHPARSVRETLHDLHRIYEHGAFEVEAPREFQGPGTSGHPTNCHCAACRNFDD